MNNYQYKIPRLFWMILVPLTIVFLSVALNAFATTPSVAVAPCASTDTVTLPLTLDGEDDTCYATSGDISYINSWNMQFVEINGVDYTNRYSVDMPERVDGKYHIRYVGLYRWSHLEVKGSGGSDDPIPQKGYTLKISAKGDGSTDPAPGTYTYEEGAAVSVNAIAADGASFTGWGGAATGNQHPISLIMDADQTLIANFSSDSDLPDHCTGPCNAATPVNPTLSNDGGTGNVTMYSTGASNGGACNYGATDVMYYAAINAHVVPGDGQGNWQGGTACGQCAEVTVVTSQGPRQVVVRIMDKCPDADCGIDLGGAAPGELMIDGFGRYQGQWRFVSCDGHPEVSDGPPTLDVFAGSNRWWSRVNVRNGVSGVDRIVWESADGSKKGGFPLASDPENTYEVPVNDVLHSQAASILIKVHYNDGTTASVSLSPVDLATPGSYPLN